MKHLDLFGCVISFRINGYTRYKTKLGGAITILAGILGIVTISIFSQEFFKREQPRNIIEEKKQFDPMALNLMKNNFYFAVTVAFNDVHNIRSEIFKITAFFVKIKNSNMANEDKKEVKLIPCQEKFFQGQETQFYALNLRKALCPDPASLLEVKGSYINKEYNYLRIQFDFCDIKKDASCKSMTEIEQILSLEVPKAHLYYMDSSINPNNYTQPISYFINNYNIELTFGDMKETDISFMQTNLLSYNGYLLNDAPTDYMSLAFSNARDKISVRTENRLDLMKFNIMASNQQIKIKRSYIKFSEVLANIGGLFNIILILGSQFTRYVNEFLFVIEMISNLFSYNDEILKNYKKKNTDSPLTKMIQNKKKKSLKEEDTPKKNAKKDKKDKKNKRVNNYVDSSGSEIIALESKFHDLTSDNNKKATNNEIKLENINQPTPQNINLEMNKPSAKNTEKYELTIDPQKKTEQRNTKESIFRKAETKSQFIKESLLSLVTMKEKKESDKKAVIEETKGKTLTFKQKLSYLFFPMFRKQLLRRNPFFKNTTERISNYIEFKKFMKKIQEIDIIKYILFDKDQIELFNYISRPEINFQGKHDDDFATAFEKYSSTRLKNEDEINQLTEFELKDIVRAFERMVAKDEISKKDMRIIDALNPDIKKLLTYKAKI